MDALEENNLPLHGTWQHLAQRLRQSVLESLGAEVSPHPHPMLRTADTLAARCCRCGASRAVAVSWLLMPLIAVGASSTRGTVQHAADHVCIRVCGGNELGTRGSAACVSKGQHN